MLERMESSGGFKPPALQNRKRLPVEFQFHWDAFRELSATERPEGMMGLRPIPLASFRTWADFNEVPRHEQNEIWETVTLIDRFYMEAVHKRQPKPKTKAPTS